MIIYPGFLSVFSVASVARTSIAVMTTPATMGNHCCLSGPDRRSISLSMPSRESVSKSESIPSARPGVVMVCAFFLAGACGLSYEILAMRLLRLVMGNTTFAVTTVLTAFMGGGGPSAAFSEGAWPTGSGICCVSSPCWSFRSASISSSFHTWSKRRFRCIRRSTRTCTSLFIF